MFYSEVIGMQIKLGPLSIYLMCPLSGQPHMVHFTNLFWMLVCFLFLLFINYHNNSWEYKRIYHNYTQS
ncbi:hypothetical protein AQUCO_02000443v1 [Aquilegia coerulea]|uniref:Uncharacterized protein n=1 Tax=Aquilegia coerulea TaxID=218851 RepID=A0A2G5DHI2_AQUCA|nr:hypothetical protein AQUCO_02000443v1 [Aquilegia coerulea]